MATPPEPGMPRHARDEKIITTLEEIADLLRGIAEHGPCRPTSPQGSGSAADPYDDTTSARQRPRRNNPQLTRRERQVLDILITGASNRAISRRLGIAERTVKNNLYMVYRKLGVSGRAEAIAWVLNSHGSAPRHRR
ncbi:helix-turn-helix transcriptional regulator [Streptomyces sp. AC536]|uniref:helix-turn-helix domain-containing protein n=1 Tax=Streptomyces buecherae TaxID=2763006 RepID=UPI00164DC09B|nr:helix-turn-helix transcriptional regulator [Streptomyces buecherae]MBC3986787.1 helix-turn-helix transcriptional regulator [Streptomyces buecherae]QNJ38982.1 helix-turn-helix transcriptional regulator [Streptomyces buecherae]